MTTLTHYFPVIFLVSTWSLSFAQQYYGSQAPPQVYPVQQQQNTAAWRQWYQQQQQQRQQQQQNAAAQAAYQRQLAAYNAARAAATRQQAPPVTAPQYNSYNKPAAPVAGLQQYPAGSNQQQPAAQYTQQQYQQYYQQQARLPPAQTQANPSYTLRTQQTAPASPQPYAQQPQPYAQQPQLYAQQPQPYAQQPAANSYYPTASGYTPATASGYTPSSSGYHPPAATGYHPPSSGHQGQAASIYHPPATTPPPSTTPAVPVELEVEYEQPTTTTTAAPRPAFSQWGQYRTSLKLPPTLNLRKSLNGLANSLGSLRLQIKITPRPRKQDALVKPQTSGGVNSATKTRMGHLLSAFKQVKDIVSVTHSQTGNLRSQQTSGVSPSQVNPSQVNPSQANPSQVNPSQANPSQVNPSQFSMGLEPPQAYFQTNFQQSNGPFTYTNTHPIADSGWRPVPMTTPFPHLFATSSGTLLITTSPSVTLTTEFLETEFPVTTTPAPVRQLATTTTRALDGGLPVMEFPQTPYDPSPYNVPTLPSPAPGRNDIMFNGLQGDPYKAELISTIKMLTNEIKTLSHGSEPSKNVVGINGYSSIPSVSRLGSGSHLYVSVPTYTLTGGGILGNGNFNYETLMSSGHAGNGAASFQNGAGSGNEYFNSNKNRLNSQTQYQENQAPRDWGTNTFPLGQSNYETTPTTAEAPPPPTSRDVFRTLYMDQHLAYVSNFTIPDYAPGQPAVKPTASKPEMPSQLSSLLGRLASKLAVPSAAGIVYTPVPPPIPSPVSSQVTQSTDPGSHRQQPHSKWDGLFQITTQQQEQLNQRRWLAQPLPLGTHGTQHHPQQPHHQHNPHFPQSLERTWQLPPTPQHQRSPNGHQQPLPQFPPPQNWAPPGHEMSRPQMAEKQPTPIHPNPMHPTFQVQPPPANPTLSPYQPLLQWDVRRPANELTTDAPLVASGQNPIGSQYNQQSPIQQQNPYQPQPAQSSGYNSYYPPQQPQQQQYTGQTQPQPQQQQYTGQPQPQQQLYAGQTQPQQQPNTGQTQPQQTGQPQPQQQQYAGQTQTGQFQQPSPATENLDPFSSQFDVNGLKPTIFNPHYQPPPPQPSPQQPQTQQPFGQSNPNEFAGILDQQGYGGQNPPAPANKVDFSAKGPNPIQLNQFLAQPMAPKETNSLSTNLDALLGTLLSSGASLGQQAQSKPKPTTKAPPSPASSLISDRLNDFILGPKSEFRSNAFSEIPTNGAAYDSLNPLAGFMGETPPPPTTTTPAPPGRNGDFLAGFIGVNKELSQPKTTAESFPPNIYMYDFQQTQPATPAPAPQQTNTDLANLGTQDLSALVKKLLGVLAVKQAAAGQG
ncbi:unnamed protein product [Lymnaea stagnalis]|uniref:Uncharacterized protein n=1 Tax=Lymnaea stagnalis TaxID=6523 RepID=A0AAV2IF18_LYMST